MSTQTRQPSGIPVGGQFATTGRTEATTVQLPAQAESGLSCDECGETMTVDQTGISNHRDEDGNVDHVADGEHVAYMLEIPATALDGELAALTEYDEAFEYAQDCKEDADQASVIGSRQEKAVTLAMEAGATTALDVAERRRTALALATNPAAGRPDFTDYVNPRTITEVRKALKDAKSGKVRGVLLRNEAVAKLDGRLDVAGPADGTPLFVDTSSGFSPLRVTSGTVVVNARSTMGNGIEVGPDATVVVIADPGRKVSTTVEGGVAVVVGANEARGLQFNRGGVLDVVGAAPGMTVRGATA